VSLEQENLGVTPIYTMQEEGNAAEKILEIAAAKLLYFVSNDLNYLCVKILENYSLISMTVYLIGL
jgi:hypothetical protein